jgi:hypothetical protein
MKSQANFEIKPNSKAFETSKLVMHQRYQMCLVCIGYVPPDRGLPCREYRVNTSVFGEIHRIGIESYIGECESREALHSPGVCGVAPSRVSERITMPKRGGELGFSKN